MDDMLERLRGTLADRYDVQRELGRGGMATVFLAQDRKHQRQVAIKVLDPEVAAAIGADRFLREIEIAARLQHPHILPLHDSGEAAGYLYYVMPFVEGESLRERLKRDGALPWVEATRIAREVAGALDYAHRQHIVHRDIKPGNILLSQGHAVVADFGIARALASTGTASDITQIDFAIGTPAYMSPEQAASDPELDGRTDVYALGCVLYEMLDGKPPYDGPTARAVLSQSVSGSVPRLTSAVARRLPRHVRVALTRSLARDPADRFATADDLRAALDVSVGATTGPARAAGLFAGAAAIVVALTWILTRQLGLPSWVPVVALVVAGIELPIIALTSRAVQRRLVTRALGQASGTGQLTWRRVLSGGAGAFVALAVAVAVYMGMRVFGIGPVGVLLARGVLDRQERIVVADFATRAADGDLAAAVTEAFRVDLAQSPVIRVVEPAVLARVLTRMQRPPATPVDLPVAREIATREGYKAVVAGEVNSLGAGFVLSTRLLAAADGGELAAFRETAGDSTEIVAAVDRLSKRLRARIGESLRSIRANEQLSHVTTSSLAALQKYSLGMRAIETGDILRGRSLLLEALELDTAFAMAHRKLGTVLFDRAQQVEALTRAYAYRDRLTDRERYLTLGTYYRGVTGERERAMNAYETLLATYPNDATALNNLAGLYAEFGDDARAEALYERIVANDSLDQSAHINLMQTTYALGDSARARRLLERTAGLFPENPVVELFGVLFPLAEYAFDSAEQRIAQLIGAHRGNALWHATGLGLRSGLLSMQGRIDAALEVIDESLPLIETLGIPNMALNIAIQRATIDVWYRDRPDAAMERLDAALARYPLAQIDPLNRPYLGIAQVQAFAGRVDAARATLRQFETEVPAALRRPLVGMHEMLRGVVELAANRPEAAIAVLRRADGGSACRPCPLPLMAMAYDKAGQPDSAIALYERYLATPFLMRGALLDPSFLASTYERLGQLHRALGHREEAVRYLNRFIDLWSGADAELQGRVTAARQALRDMVEESPRSP